jgi:prepilin-type N-terminal cleavage/methylation domain-containing protein
MEAAMPRPSPSSPPAYPARRRPARGAFTLIEILVVLVILSMLAAMILAGANAMLHQRDVAATTNTVQRLMVGLATLRNETRQLPAPNSEGHLHHHADGRSGALDRLVDFRIFSYSSDQLNVDRVLVDSWGQPFRYAIGEGTTDPGIIPRNLIANGTITDWKADSPTGPYVYSIGPTGAIDDPAEWIYTR